VHVTKRYLLSAIWSNQGTTPSALVTHTNASKSLKHPSTREDKSRKQDHIKELKFCKKNYKQQMFRHRRLKNREQEVRRICTSRCKLYEMEVLGHPVPRGYKYGDLDLQVRGVSNESVKYGREFCGTWPPESLLWYGPETIVRVNYRPVLSSERASHSKKPTIVK
jgi:hypothetical protein